MMVSLVQEFGSTLTGRIDGSSLRERVEEHAGRGEPVVLDFNGVEAISPSFADEIFGKLAPDLVESGLVQFENLGEDLLSLARFVAQNRAARAGD